MSNSPSLVCPDPVRREGPCSLPERASGRPGPDSRGDRPPGRAKRIGRDKRAAAGGATPPPFSFFTFGCYVSIYPYSELSTLPHSVSPHSVSLSYPSRRFYRSPIPWSPFTTKTPHSLCETLPEKNSKVVLKVKPTPVGSLPLPRTG